MNTVKILKKMTTEEKARLLCGTTQNSIGGFESSAGPIPEIALQDGGTGINFMHLFGRGLFNMELVKEYSPEEGFRVINDFYEPDKLTEREKVLRKAIHDRLTELRSGIDEAPGCYPPGILLASTWNPKVVYETGRALGMEAAVYRVGVLLGTPNCNILREPVNGRFFEGYSEDPFLAKTLAPEMCKGVESMGIASNVKHFTCNNLEKNRQTVNELIDERTMREIYFPAFEECSKVSSTLMTAYPRINGKYCTENPWLLIDVLRKGWGYEGVTVTDWDAKTTDMGNSVSCSQDLFMPGPRDPSEIVKAVKDGVLSVKDLDRAAKRVLDLIYRFSNVKAPEGLTSAKYKKTGDKAAFDAAAEGIVMLKNKGNLPLTERSKVVFFGPERFKDYGSGSAKVLTSRTGDLYDELCSILGSSKVLRNDIEAYKKGAVAIVIETIESGEGCDRPDLKLNKKTVSTIRKLAKERGKGKVCLILNTPGPVELGEIEDDVDSIFAVFYPGMMGARAMAGILTGKINPSGSLPCTFPVSYKDTPAYLCYPDSLTCRYGEGIYTGYRGYQKRGIKPMYSFGYGLSYSVFKADQIESSHKGNKVYVKCRLTNTGKRDGKKIVQIYVSKHTPQTGREPFRLVGFAKPLVKAGLYKDVAVSFDKSELSYFDEEYGKFLIEGGRYDIYISLNGCDDLIPAGNIYIEGSDELKCGSDWPISRIAESKALTDAVAKDFESLGFPLVAFAVNLEYVPSMKLSELFGETDKLVNFKKAAKEYRPE